MDPQNQRRRSRLTLGQPGTPGASSRVTRRLSDSIARAQNGDNELEERARGILKDTALAESTTRRNKLTSGCRRQSLPSLTVDTGSLQFVPQRGSRGPRSGSSHSVGIEPTSASPGPVPTTASSPTSLLGSPPSTSYLCSSFPLKSASPLLSRAPPAAAKTDTCEPAPRKVVTEDVIGSPRVDDLRRTNTVSLSTDDKRTLSHMGTSCSSVVSKLMSEGDLEEDIRDMTALKSMQPQRVPSCKSLPGLGAPTPVEGIDRQPASGTVATGTRGPADDLATKVASQLDKNVNLGNGDSLKGVKLLGDLEHLSSTCMQAVVSSVQRSESESEATISDAEISDSDSDSDQGDEEPAPVSGLALPETTSMHMPRPRRDRDRNAIMDMDYNVRRRNSLVG